MVSENDVNMDYIIRQGKEWQGMAWPQPEERRVVRYRWSRSMHCYVEVIYDGKYYSGGLTMPDGFVPPEDMR